MPLLSSQRIFSSSKEIKAEDEENVDENEPVKYSTSQASKHRPLDTFLVKKKPPPWYQPFSILFSVYGFLLYFCVLREENDWDDELGKSIFERIPGLLEQTEKAQKSTIEDVEALVKNSDSSIHIVRKKWSRVCKSNGMSF